MDVRSQGVHIICADTLASPPGSERGAPAIAGSQLYLGQLLFQRNAQAPRLYLCESDLLQDGQRNVRR